MSFREELLLAVEKGLKTLLNGTVNNDLTPHPNGDIELRAKDGKLGVLRGVHLGPLADTITDDVPDNAKDSAPVAYVSFDGGRHDLGIDTLLSHIVEVLGIRIEIVLNKKIGVPFSDGIRPIPLQVSDLLSDIDDIATVAFLGTAVRTTVPPIEDPNAPHIIVQDAVIEEWELDLRFRGGDVEVLSLLIQVQVASERSTTPTPGSGN